MSLYSAEIVRRVAENKRPFQIVNDHGFQSLMKTGCPAYHIPLAETVSHDVKRVFVEACKCITEMFGFRLTSVFEFVLTNKSSGI
jgi:hypothetical protein